MKRFFLVPLGLFALLLLFLGRGLQLDAREIPSPLVGKPAPTFSLQRLDVGQPVFTPAQMHGQVWLLNVWASWCAPCREELPALKALASRNVAPIVGLSYKDTPEKGQAWLNQFGNPYVFSALDRDGKVGIDYGVYGVPETFVIDRQGIVRLKHTGPVTPEAVRDELLPLIAKLKQ